MGNRRRDPNDRSSTVLRSQSSDTIKMMIYKIITAFIVLSASATAATYKGKTVDGVSYGCTIKQNRVIHSCSVVFDGRRASVKLTNGIFDVRLASEIIDNTKEIEGYIGPEPIVLNVDLPD